MPTRLRNYFLESSPRATFISDLPQAPHKRSRQEVNKDTMAKKVAKLEEKNKMQNKVIVQQKATMEAMELQHEKLMSQMINWKMAELQVQVAGGNPDYQLIRSMGCDIKSIIELTPESLRVAMEAQFSCQYEEVKRMFLTSVDASQWAKIEIITFANIHVAALPPAPSPSSDDVPHKRSREEVDKGTLAKKALSSCTNQLLHEPSPFNNLKCLNQTDCIPRMPIEVNYQLLESSPSATFNMDLPQVPYKRSRQEADNGTMANTLEEAKQQTKTMDEEKRMLEAKIVMQDKLIVEQKTIFEAMKVQHEKKMLEAKIHVQDNIIAQQKKAMVETTKLLHENGMLEEKMQMQDKMIAEQKVMLDTLKLQNEKKIFEEKMVRQDKIIAQQKTKLEAMKLQHEKIDRELDNIDG